MTLSPMGKTRLEAFSDGVLAIAITIMILEIKPPHGAMLSDLLPLFPKFLSYVLSFIYIGIYWTNHHHMINTVGKVTGKILWANLHLIFWLTLISFATTWMGENHYQPIPVVIYGVVLLMCAIAYLILQKIIIKTQGEHSILKEAIAQDKKGLFSLISYTVAILVGCIYPKAALTIYTIVAFVWIIPDTRIEKLHQ